MKETLTLDELLGVFKLLPEGGGRGLRESYYCLAPERGLDLRYSATGHLDWLAWRDPTGTLRNATDIRYLGVLFSEWHREFPKEVLRTKSKGKIYWRVIIPSRSNL